jgi:hypothetical protein
VYQWDARATGVDVIDTVAYLADYGLKTASVANPTAPYVLDTIFEDDFTNDVVVVDSLAILGGYTVRIFNVADPRDIRLVGFWAAPDVCNRLSYSAPYLYASCYAAGVCILETESLGVAEDAAEPVPRSGLQLGGSIVRGDIALRASDLGGKEVTISTYNSAGRLVETCALRGQGTQVRYSFARMPAGVYVLRAHANGRTHTFKVVKL